MHLTSRYRTGYPEARTERLRTVWVVPCKDPGGLTRSIPGLARFSQASSAPNKAGILILCPDSTPTPQLRILQQQANVAISEQYRLWACSGSQEFSILPLVVWSSLPVTPPTTYKPFWKYCLSPLGSPLRNVSLNFGVPALMCLYPHDRRVREKD